MAFVIDACPSYDELPTLGDTDEHHGWDVFGPGDELGCLNFITPTEVVAAAAEVTTGEVVNLNLPLGEPQPQFWASRQPPQYHALHASPNIRDDYIDKLFTQGSTQWDGFRHMRYRQFGYYGGRQDDALDERGEIGIDVWAERGVIGRGVLIDVPRHTEVAPDARLPIGPELIEEVLDAQNTAICPGDILLLHTGWLEWYQGLDTAVRTEMATRLEADRTKAALPGMAPSRELAAWLWDHRIAAVAVDNPTAETVPYLREEGWGHHRFLVLLGLPLGELWSLTKLAEACRREGRWSFLLSTAPMNLPRGVASPANAYAVL